MKKNKYKCIHCGKVVERESEKKWIKSWCDEKGKDVRLQKQ
jgi:DNA-directed RNA polymerase subunit RPC12/RpoP